jgi:hypothetical protein
MLCASLLKLKELKNKVALLLENNKRITVLFVSLMSFIYLLCVTHFWATDTLLRVLRLN